MCRHVRTLDEARATAEKGAILNAFEQAGSNITHAADYLNVSRGTLYRLMEKYQITWPDNIDLNSSRGEDGDKIKQDTAIIRPKEPTYS